MRDRQDNRAISSKNEIITKFRFHFQFLEFTSSAKFPDFTDQNEKAVDGSPFFVIIQCNHLSLKAVALLCAIENYSQVD